jgi:hypothetical protein
MLVVMAYTAGTVVCQSMAFYVLSFLPWKTILDS